MKHLIFAVLILVLTNNKVGFAAMSEKQLKATLKLIRNVCQPKNKVTDAQIDAMHNGQWDQDKSVECYMSCVLNYYKLQLPDNSFDWETGLKVIEVQAPLSMQSHMLFALTSCKDAVKTKEEKCRAAMEISKCIYDAGPDKYFLP